MWGYFHTKTEDDFLAAGRSIGPWVGGAVLAATQISAGTFVGTLGRHYLTGVSWVWIWFGVWAGWVISAMFVAPKLRRFGALTVADYVGKRFASEGARTLAAGAHHRHLHDLSRRAVSGDRRDRGRHLRRLAARGDDGAAGEHRASTPRSAAFAPARTSSSCRR